MHENLNFGPIVGPNLKMEGQDPVWFCLVAYFMFINVFVTFYFRQNAKILHSSQFINLFIALCSYLAVNTYFTYLLFERNLYINPTHITLILLTSFVLKFSSYSNANSILLQGELNQNELDFILHGRIYKTRVFSVHLHIV